MNYNIGYGLLDVKSLTLIMMLFKAFCFNHLNFATSKDSISHNHPNPNQYLTGNLNHIKLYI